MSDPQDDLPAMEVLPIAYSSPMVAGRPAAITVIGVLSIVIGSLSILTSGVIGLWSVSLLTFATAARSASVSSSANTVAYSAASGNSNAAASPVGSGLPSAERQIIVDGLSRVRPLSAVRRSQLDELLSEDGKDVFVLRGDALTVERVAANVSDSGRLIGSRDSADGPDFFTLGEGRVEVADDHASFFPANGGSSVRVSAEIVNAEDEAAASAGASTTSPASSLTSRQIQSVLRRVQSMGGQLNPAQIQALTQALKAPGQQFIAPATDGSDVAKQMLSAKTLADGSSYLNTHHGNTMASLQFDKNGVLVSSYVNSAVASSAFATSSSGGPSINMPGVVVFVVGCALNLLLAVYLLICGIMVLRQSRQGARMHRIYALLKIVAALLVAGASAVISWQFIQSVSAGYFLTRMAIFLVAMALVGCAYPIALLITLRTRKVREYYASVQ